MFFFCLTLFALKRLHVIEDRNVNGLSNVWTSEPGDAFNSQTYSHLRDVEGQITRRRCRVFSPGIHLNMKNISFLLSWWNSLSQKSVATRWGVWRCRGQKQKALISLISFHNPINQTNTAWFLFCPPLTNQPYIFTHTHTKCVLNACGAGRSSSRGTPTPPPRPTPPPLGVRPLYVLLIALLLHVVLNHVFHASSVVLSHLAH